jgi:hypothetical protein
MQVVTVTIPVDDAERVLREAAKKAAQYGALVDYVTRRTGGSVPWCGHRMRFEDARAEWKRRFLKAKATVECFGVEYEPTSEGETLTVGFEHKTKAMRNIAGMTFREVEDDFTKPRPEYRGGVHDAACEAAAERVVRQWLELNKAAKAA